MYFFTPNNSAERSLSNVLLQVQPAGELPCLTPLKAPADILSRLNEVRVKQFVIDSTVTIA
jgi:hypothetical protein